MTTTTTTPRGLRNNNPLNIEKNADLFVGEVLPSKDVRFKQFATMAHGYRAAMCILRTYQTRHGCERLGDFISRWAPPAENDVHAYIRAVCKHSGLADMSDLTTVDTTNEAQMCGIIAGMSFHENGLAADMSDIREGWIMYAETLRIKKTRK